MVVPIQPRPVRESIGRRFDKGQWTSAITGWGCRLRVSITECNESCSSLLRCGFRRFSRLRVGQKNEFEKRAEICPGHENETWIGAHHPAHCDCGASTGQICEDNSDRVPPCLFAKLFFD